MPGPCSARSSNLQRANTHHSIHIRTRLCRFAGDSRSSRGRHQQNSNGEPYLSHFSRRNPEIKKASDGAEKPESGTKLAGCLGSVRSVVVCQTLGGDCRIGQEAGRATRHRYDNAAATRPERGQYRHTIADDVIPIGGGGRRNAPEQNEHDQQIRMN
jgi:hypothetical protein